MIPISSLKKNEKSFLRTTSIMHNRRQSSKTPDLLSSKYAKALRNRFSNTIHDLTGILLLSDIPNLRLSEVISLYLHPQNYIMISEIIRSSGHFIIIRIL